MELVTLMELMTLMTLMEVIPHSSDTGVSPSALAPFRPPFLGRRRLTGRSGKAALRGAAPLGRGIFHSLQASFLRSRGGGRAFARRFPQPAGLPIPTKVLSKLLQAL